MSKRVNKASVIRVDDEQAVKFSADAMMYASARALIVSSREEQSYLSPSDKVDEISSECFLDHR